MNIAFFTNYVHTPHFETELELIQLHLDKGDTVYHFVCDMHLLSCDFNPAGDLLKCISCKSKRAKGQELLVNTKHYREIKISKIQNKSTLNLPETSFSSIAELKKYKIDDFDIGEAALSSFVSIIRDPAPDLVLHKDLLSDILLSAHYCYQYFQSELVTYAIDTFYNFNGRFATNRAALRAAQKNGVSTYIHERGHNFQFYELYHNVLPHQIAPFTDRVKQSWNSHPNEEDKIRIAHDFYKNRVHGKEQGWVSFVGNQKKGLLPDNWDESVDNIVIFNSSEDEFVSIGKEWELGIFESQNKLIHKLMNDSRLSDKKIWVRLHPNMKAMASRYLEKTYAELKGNVEVILPEAPISSYDLMNAAQKILTFGSTVGIESTYWGKPSILLGPSFYRAFEATYNPNSYEELIMLLLDKDLQPLAKENTLPYGFHVNNFGVPFKIYEPKNLFEGTFKNVDLGKFFPIYKWKKLINKRGFHWLYNRLNKLNHTLLLRKYV